MTNRQWAQFHKLMVSRLKLSDYEAGVIMSWLRRRIGTTA
jgi:hypothetical protein